MPHQGDFAFVAAESDAGKRLDAFLSQYLQDCTRSRAAKLIQQHFVTVNGQIKKPSYRVHPGETIRGVIPPPHPSQLKPEPIPLEVLYEDSELIVVDKQPGLVVHPAPGHATGTLVNALLHHCRNLSGIDGERRPGIVHRLDKDTSGVLVAAKNDAAHQKLAQQFKTRRVTKIYLTLVYGAVSQDSGTIDLAIGRHPIDRKRMSTLSRKSRKAETSWQVETRLAGATLLKVELKTGRTHQIRVHCAAIHHPVVGDKTYGGRRARRAVDCKEAADKLKGVSRQMLHAWQLGIQHPTTGKPMLFEAPLPPDMRQLIDDLSC